jgi:hypothetical protein
MSELRERFRTLDRMQPPDLRQDILLRARAVPQPPLRSRLAAAAVAVLVSVATLGFLFVAFRDGQRRPPATNSTEIEAIVEGVRLSWPGSWTLVQLSETSPDEHRWPMFQLTNFDPGLDAESLCPFAQQLPDDGVALYVQRDFDPIAESYDDWPVDVDPGAISDVGCDGQTTAAWSVQNSLFQAALTFGPEASEEDRATLLRIFADLEVVDAGAGGSGRRLDPSFRNTWYVAWGVRADDPELATVYLVGDDPTESRPTRVLATSSGGIGWGPFDPDRLYRGMGDRMLPDRSFVQSWGVALEDVRQVLLVADDGRELEVTLGPSLDRFGLPARPAYVEFEPPLLGEYVAFGPDGEVLGRVPEKNWPPPKATTPTPSPSPQKEEGVWLPDSEAKRDREEIDAATDGPVLMRGNNWNYPWVVYLSSDGTLTYRDADSVSPIERGGNPFWGTRFSFSDDPEILFVGVASGEVEWFGVERKDGSTIIGSFAIVPGSDERVISVTVSHPRSGDRLVARDTAGALLQEERLEMPTPDG